MVQTADSAEQTHAASKGLGSVWRCGQCGGHRLHQTDLLSAGNEPHWGSRT